jgi:SAM-dependent methyltransferase
MRSKYETEMNLENELTQLSEQSVRKNSKAVYDRLTCYGFARRFTKGKVVADIGWEEIGYGSRLLAESAGSVAGIANSTEAVELASTIYRAPNVSYQRAVLPELPYSGGYFDTVLTFGVIENLEHPENLVKEAKRVLKKDGVLVISALDKRALANDRRSTDGRREMYVLEFRELLERHFGYVNVYRQGAVAGGIVFPASEEVTGALVESARPSSVTPHFGAEPPITRSVIAVCGDAEALGHEEQPYLLLDRDRRVFDECEDRAEDVDLMRNEIQRMQETEVQAFQTALILGRSAGLHRYLIYLRNVTRGLRWRLSGSYRRLRDRSRRSK